MRYTCITNKFAILFTMLWFIFCQSPANASSSETIFKWVKAELKSTENYPVPVVHFLNKKGLQKVFLQYNERSFKSWADEYGQKKADELLTLYLDQVQGLCIPETQQLYVGSFIEDCKRDSIVAHELVHYFQVKKDGVLDLDSYDFENKHLYNEMQAGMIERTYLEDFCGAK